MLFRAACLLLAMPLAWAMPQVPASDDQVWISDILANPSRYWNTTVTVIGQVLDATANPAGTTRGTYTLLDDSTTTPLTIRSRDLPPVGREFAVTGVVVQDPAQANVPLLDELSRGSPGMGATMRYLLVGGAVLFGVLLIILLVLLMRPQKAPVATAAPPGPAAPSPVPDSFEPTRKISPTVPAAQAAEVDDATKVFMNLGAEVVVEKGPDQGATFAIHKQVTNIGRAGTRKNDVELSDDTVSKEQASILYDTRSQAFRLQNQSTTNPTTVNNRLVADPVELEADAVIQMGSTILRFRKE